MMAKIREDVRVFPWWAIGSLWGFALIPVGMTVSWNLWGNIVVMTLLPIAFMLLVVLTACKIVFRD